MNIQEFSEKGFVVIKNSTDQSSLYMLICEKHRWDNPTCGYDICRKYHDQFYESVEWNNYWTISLIDNTYAKRIEQGVKETISLFMSRPVLHHCNISVVMPNAKQIYPHVDIPHSCIPWNKKMDCCLGLQAAIPMQSFTKHVGSTAFLPRSHGRVWDIKRCCSGDHDSEFLRGCEVPQVDFSDLIIWDSRVLHSVMPNITHNPRYMLRYSYIEKKIFDDLQARERNPYGILRTS